MLSLPDAVNLATRYQAMGNLKDSENLLCQVLDKEPRHAQALHLLGIIKHQRGDLGKGLSLIKQAIQSDPTQGLFYSNYAEMSRLAGNIDDAIKYGELAVQFAPDMAAAHSNLGIAYFDKSDLDQALKHQLKALELDPNLAAALNNIASIKRDKGDKEGAVTDYKKLLKISPHYVEAMSNAGATLSELERFDEALPLLAQALQYRPDYAEAHCNIGSAFLGLENYDKALLGFQNALKYKEDYPNALIGLAKVYQEHRAFEQAEELLDHALTLEPDNLDALVTRACIFIESGKSSKAEQVLLQALALNPEHPEALNAQATILTEQGDLEQAEVLLNRAANLDSKNSLASHLALSQVRKIKEHDAHFIALREADKNAQALSNKKRLALNFSLGKCYDDLKEADLAFPYFIKGCQQKRQGIEYSSDAHTAYIESIKNHFNRDFFAKPEATSNSELTPIFVLGMPRSGTTLTEQIIASHPQVYGAGELPDLDDLVDSMGDSFPSAINKLSQNDFSELGKRYLAALESYSDKHAYITDKMPVNHQYIGLIKAILPQAKIIHVKRNPVDTCLSCYTKHFSSGQAFSYDLVELGRYYRDYAGLMDHWRNVLPAGAFYEVEYERLVSENAVQAKLLIDYCGLEWDDACLASHKTKRNVRTASVSQVRQPIYSSSIARWKPYEKYLQPLLRELGDLVENN